MSLSKTFLFLIPLIAISFLKCAKDEEELEEYSQLEFYIEQKKSLTRDILIGCAAGSKALILADTAPTLSIFFYAVDSAKDFRCFQSKTANTDPNDFSTYSSFYAPKEELFNGRMKRFVLPNDTLERWVVLTYLSPGKLHVSDPIRIKTISSPTYHIETLLTIEPNGVNPKFNWEKEQEPNNIIYFEIVSDSLANMLSGTYTNDKYWTFYDLSNVVLNVTPSNQTPVLSPQTKYGFTLMGVSEDNWVHTVAMQEFITD